LSILAKALATFQGTISGEKDAIGIKTRLIKIDNVSESPVRRESGERGKKKKVLRSRESCRNFAMVRTAPNRIFGAIFHSYILV
jgi:hypothetical protein